MSRWTCLTLPILLLLALVGCGGPKTQYKYRVAVIPKGLSHQFWQSIHRGAERAAADLASQGIAVEIVWVGPRTEDDAQAQITLVEQQVANGVSGIVLAPQHSAQMVPAVQSAVTQNIPVLVIDSGLDARDSIVKYVATNNYHGGELAAKRLLDELKAEGKSAPKLVLFRYKTGSESTDQREKGFVDHVNRVIEEQNKRGEPTITWLSTNRYAGATIDSALAVATPLLNSLQDQGIDGIFAPNESSATGMLKALQSLGLNKKVCLIGFDSSEPLLQAVHDGDIDALIVQDPYRMGYLGVWTLVQHLEGKDVTPGGEKEQSTGEYLVTKENLNEVATRELFDPDMQAKRTIQTPAFAAKK
ncbi:MAG TPA: substrate-binding domain-containing protein [Gemmataceae bacterium]|nr:substrate-binding domain-containing protein [Gemmataceae bacterium]